MAKRIISAIISGALFGGLIYLLRTYDVAAIGPEGTSVGFSTVNRMVHDLTGVNMSWYEITEYIGYFALGICALFAFAGLAQLIRRKSLFKVDRAILGLGVLYAVVLGLYVLFEKIVINYRPIIMPGAAAPEASFPSSHTMLIITVMASTSLVLGHSLRINWLKGLIRALCFIVILVTVFGRLYCGVHWFTDIVGGVLLSTSLAMIYSAFLYAGRPEQGYDEGAGPYEDDEIDFREDMVPIDDGYVPKH